MNKIDKIIFELLKLDGNETNYIKEEGIYCNFIALIKELTKVKYNIRYCTNQNCICHPEYSIKILLKNHDLVNFLEEHSYEGIVKDIKVLITNYKPIVANGLY